MARGQQLYYEEQVAKGRERLSVHAPTHEDLLGPEAEDPIEEFLALALAYEREHVPSLQGFLRWLGGSGADFVALPLGFVALILRLLLLLLGLDIHLFDLFPQTFHMQAVTRLRRRE